MKSSLAGFYLIIVMIGVAISARAAEAPNIILVMADDMGMGDTSAYQDFTGNADDVQLNTPQMERLARLGIRFTDAHTPASRCTPTRYGLLTGRYHWRSRLKWWVLFGSQGDPLIEADRPTLASMLRRSGYATAMVGKWHVGLRYRQSDGSPAAGWSDADLAKPLHTTPLDAGFDYARFTSRSHGTSGPDAGAKTKPVKNAKKRNARGGGSKRNSPTQNVGPGHIHGRAAVSATGDGKKLIADGPDAYVLTKLGSRHSDHAMAWLRKHVAGADTQTRPFFLYYPSNSNHGPYTPDKAIGGVPVKSAGRTKSGKPMDARHDYIYENDVALGRLMDWLAATDDPRRPGSKLDKNTLVIFTSDNGAEKNSDIATGPFRSHKGSTYEGGHRVPFIVSWPVGGVGDGNAETPGKTSAVPIGLQDLFATFAEMVGHPLPDPRAGRKGAEDSVSVLAAFRGQALPERPPLFFNDHKEARDDAAACAMRLDNPTVNGVVFKGQWKIFFSGALVRRGVAKPYELFDLATDQWEKTNRLDDPKLEPLVAHLTEQASLHRNIGGHRLASLKTGRRIVFDNLAIGATGRAASGHTAGRDGVKITVTGMRGDKPLNDAVFKAGERGLGLSGGDSDGIDGGEAIVLRFDRDVVVESIVLVAGKGQCGGFYQVGDTAPLAIYCIDADNDTKTQEGAISDIGVLKAGVPLRLDSSRHFGVEAVGDWGLRSVTIRAIKD